MKYSLSIFAALAIFFVSPDPYGQASKAIKISPQAATDSFVAELSRDSPVDMNKLKYYVRCGADIHAATIHNWTLLHEATFQGDTALMTTCIRNHLDVNSVVSHSFSRHSVLYYAIKNNDPSAQRILSGHNAVLCIPNGYSVQVYDSAKYEGNFKNEMKEGKGTMYYTGYGNRYEGEWRNDQKNGFGVFYYADGRKYEGNWKDGDRDGQGTFSWSNGDRYVGTYTKGDREGKGVYQWGGGEQYSGDWVKNKRQGYGIDSLGFGTWFTNEWRADSTEVIYEHTARDSTVYIGQWDNDRRNGKGIARYPNGDSYDGDWKDDQPNGHGTFTRINNFVYEGHWVNGERDGMGTMTWSDGDRYTGEFKKNYRTGKGEYRWPDSSVYVGNWENNLRQGYGEFTCGPGEKMEGSNFNRTYKGYWEHDKRSGMGAYYNRNGKKDKDRLFVNNMISRKPLIKRDTLSSNKPLNTFFIEPVSLVDVQNGMSLRLGTERRLYGRWAVAGTGGLYVYRGRGWMVKGELKRYMKYDIPGFKTYVSAEYFYKQSVYDQSDSIMLLPHYKADYKISKFITGLRIKWGTVQLLAHKLEMEYYVGGGIRFRAATSTLTQNEYDNINYETDGGFIYPYTSALGNTIRPDITFGIRFGIRY